MFRLLRLRIGNASKKTPSRNQQPDLVKTRFFSQGRILTQAPLAPWLTARAAENRDRYVTGLAKLPFMVGGHWFEYCDEPAEGRFDGENSNYGLVNINDDPWTVLVTRVQAVNQRLEEIHRRLPAGGPVP